MMTGYTDKIKILLVIAFFCLIPFKVTADESASFFLNKLVEKFDAIDNYSTLMESAAGETKTVIDYTYRKPGFIKMLFVDPHEGASLSYNPEIKKAVIRPFKSMPSINLTLEPDNGLITSPGGHTVDKSDMGSLLQVIMSLHKHGDAVVLQVENRNRADNNKSAHNKSDRIVLEIKGKNGFTVNKINRYVITFDTERYFPTEVKAYGKDGTLAEHMVLKDVQIDGALPAGTF